jgi:hypothetical protein
VEQVTPEEFAQEHNLSLEEAKLILARRAIPTPPPGAKLTLARLSLTKAERKVGVHPVVVEGGWIEKEHDPEAEEGFLSFYANKGGSNLPQAERPKRRLNQKPVAAEDESQDPEDY